MKSRPDDIPSFHICAPGAASRSGTGGRGIYDVRPKRSQPSANLPFRYGQDRGNGALPGWSYPRDEPDGFDVALAKFLQEKYGFTLELVPLRPEERETELRNGHVDLVIANYSIDGSSWLDKERVGWT
ncbi:MAG TPA: transporter substrate-binding domain-containing protein [Actinophytocola sp.]|nr:transporter substrate-binding domain-containing protein [Actinophytocola sp.]